ncbi:recombinase family protein [Enterovibrio calviensis]|uniref:recombinase family protein n=1 Tax=Enterovibrio calviensis TaxID=91359 RepID=UPI000482E331|nr:recombinase family protein [Enterovibrio calviensis]
MNTYYSYLRFSSGKQSKGDSFKRQTELAEAYEKANGITISDTRFADLGVSAYHKHNLNSDAGLGRFIAAVECGEIATPCTLLVEDFDRMSRADVDTALSQLINLTNHQVKIVTLFDGRTYQKGMGVTEYITAIVAMQRAYEESDTKSKRLKSKWLARRVNPEEHKKSKNCPFWLEPSEDKQSYVLNDSAEIVARMFDYSVDGFGSLRIAKILNGEGIKSPKGSDWSCSTISKVLSSRAVIGEYQHHTREGRKSTPVGEPVPNYFPAAISEDTFYLSQSRRKGRHRSQQHGTTRTHLNVLRKIGTCLECGSHLTLVSHDGLNYLKCTASTNGTCKQGKFNLFYLRDWLKEQFVSPMFHSVWSKQVKKTRDNSKQIATLEGRQSSMVADLERMLEAFGALSSPLIVDKIAQRTEQIASLETEIEELKEKDAENGSIHLSLRNTNKLVNKAFKSGNEPEQLAARMELRRLLTGFDSFRVIVNADLVVCFEVVAGDKTFVFHSRPSVYRRPSIDLPVWKLTFI